MRLVAESRRMKKIARKRPFLLGPHVLPMLRCGDRPPSAATGSLGPFRNPYKITMLGGGPATATGLRSSLKFSPTRSLTHPVSRPRTRTATPPYAFKIDRRHHLNLAWERQQRDEELRSAEHLAATIAAPRVAPVADLPHFEALLEASGGRLVVLFVHSASCGVCKAVHGIYNDVCAESHRQRARTVFLEHDIYDVYDNTTALARFYNVRATPRFLFFVDGSLLRTMSMADVRAVRNPTPLESEQQRLRAILFELLVKHAPGARR